MVAPVIKVLVLAVSVLFGWLGGKHVSQTGIVGCCHIDDYNENRIKKHEVTRKDKEDDRTRHMLALGAQTGPVFLTYRASADVNDLAVPVVAIDLPTGLSADTHEIGGDAIVAAMTVTLAAPKIPLVLPPELVVFIGLALTSTLWSVAPELTLRRAFGLIGTVIVGLALAQRMTATDLLEAVRRTVVIVALASLVLYVGGSAAAPRRHAEEEAGVLVQRTPFDREGRDGRHLVEDVVLHRTAEAGRLARGDPGAVDVDVAVLEEDVDRGPAVAGLLGGVSGVTISVVMTP